MSLVLRIYVGMAAMIATMLCVGGFAIVKTNDLSALFVEYRQTSKASLLAGDVSTSLLDARLAASKYRLTHDPAFLADGAAHLDRVIALLPEFSSALQGFPEQEALRAIPEMLAAYQTHLQRAADLQQRRDDLVDQTATHGQNARLQMAEVMETALRKGQAVAGAQAGIAANSLLRAHLYLETYLVDNDPASSARSQSESQAARAALDRLAGNVDDPRLRTLIDATLADLTAFDAAARDVVDVIANRNLNFEGLDRLGPESLALVNAALTAVVTRQNTLGPVAMVTANRSIWVVGAIVFFGLMLGALLAFGTGRFLSRKINALTESMIGLADGNLDVPMPSTKGKDEIARMTKSMGVFAANARKARDLDAEIKRKTAEDQKRAAEDRARDADAQAAQQAADARDRAAAQARLDTMEQFQAEMEDVLDRAASGDFSRRMSAETEDPALQGVARAVNRLLEATETNIDDMVRSIGALAEGNLTTRIDGTRDGAFARMQADFNDALAALSQTLAQITQTGHSVSSTAAELESSSTGMAKRAEQTAAAVEETSAAVAQITESIRQVVQNANAANDATHKVRDSAERSRAVSDKTEAAISSMMEASGQIDRVVKVIEDIAFQINLLALNAGIEAARAGDAGRGFSVVASEVRALSLRSHDAVQSITAVIETNTQSVQAGVEQVHLSRRAIETIVSEVELASQQIGDIAEAVENQSQSIEEVNGAIRSIDASAQANAAALEEMTMSSASLRGEAMALSDALTQFEASPQAETPPPARRAS